MDSDKLNSFSKSKDSLKRSNYENLFPNMPDDVSIYSTYQNVFQDQERLQCTDSQTNDAPHDADEGCSEIFLKKVKVDNKGSFEHQTRRIGDVDAAVGQKKENEEMGNEQSPTVKNDSKSFFKYGVDDVLEYIEISENSDFSFAWYNVVVIKACNKIIGKAKIPYYVIQFQGNNANPKTISTEEWQLRRPLENHAIVSTAGALKANTCIEYRSEIDGYVAWFMAKVAGDSPHLTTNPQGKIRIQYLNEIWNTPAYKSLWLVERSRIRIVPDTEKISYYAWKGMLSKTLISDEEHIIEHLLEKASKLKSQASQTQLSIREFEKYRDQLCEILDSLSNSRYYKEARDLLEWLEEAEMKLAFNDDAFEL